MCIYMYSIHGSIQFSLNYVFGPNYSPLKDTFYLQLLLKNHSVIKAKQCNHVMYTAMYN